MMWKANFTKVSLNHNISALMIDYFMYNLSSIKKNN